MRIAAIIFAVFIFSGCFTSYQNIVEATLHIDNSEESVLIESTLFNVVHAIATKNNLHYDSLKSVSGRSAGYFGRPYHYFLFTISDSSTRDSKVIQFTHDAKMSSSDHDYNESEYMLIDSLKAIFPNRIQTMKIIHRP